jgi:hypothetical protein
MSALLAGVVLALLGSGWAASVARASTSTWPVAEGVCLGGLPWAEEGYQGCPALAPHTEDLGRPVAVLTGAGERYLYVVEQAYTVNYQGGEYPKGADTIVQLRNEGADAQPKFVSCLSVASTPDCKQISNHEALFQAQSAVLSSSGEELYVASLAGIARFQIGSSGGLEYEECVGLAGGHCETPRGSVTSGETVQLTLAGDGHDLYAAEEGTLTDFHVSAQGALSLGECYDVRSACSSSRVREYGFGVAAVTPNGDTVIAAFEGGNVDVYKRAAGGSLTFTSCLAASGSECPAVGGSVKRALLKPQAIAIAPDGRDIYLTGTPNASGLPEDAVAHLRLTEAGTLEFVGCTGDIEGCEPLPAKALPAEWGGYRADQRLAVTPSGGKLLLGSDGVIAFTINASSGALTWKGCAGSAPFCAPGEGESIGAQGGSLQPVPSGSGVWIADAGSGKAARMNFDTTLSAQGKPAPTVGATVVSNVDLEAADVTATVQAHGLPTNRFFELEEVTGGHISYLTAQPFRSAGETEEVQGELRLLPGKSYRVRTVAINAAGTGSGPWASVKTKACVTGEVPANAFTSSTYVTASSISIVGAVNAGCLATTIKLQYGTSTSYGQTVEFPSSRLPLAYRPAPYFLEATNLKADTTYYLRVTATNKRGSTVLEENWRTTDPAVPPEVQVATSTGAFKVTSQTTVTVEGALVAGDTPASVEAQLFDDPGHPYEPSRTIPLAKEPASRKPVTVSGSITGLKCGHTYEWQLAAYTPYGESLGVRKPLTIPCTPTSTPPAKVPAKETSSPGAEQSTGGSPTPGSASEQTTSFPTEQSTNPLTG